jgi:hypothetical protein
MISASGSRRILQESVLFPRIPVVSQPKQVETGWTYTRNMEAVFRPETYRTGNRSFPNTSRHRNTTGTCQFPAENLLERRRIHRKTHGKHMYTFGNRRESQSDIFYFFISQKPI